MERMKRYVLIFICTAAYALRGSSQDIHFSQFSENPSLLNPALTGASGLRASLNYKNQWKSVSTPYKTYGASFEMRSPSLGGQRDGEFGSKTAETKAGRFGAGISVYKDKMGDANLSLSQANLSIAYFLRTGSKSNLSLGVQGSYSQRRLDNSKFIFPNQYSGSGYDPGLNSNEAFGQQNFSYMDAAAGLLWTYDDEERRIRDHKHVAARIGFSAYHLLQPKQKYLVNGKDAIPFKYVSHGDFHISIQNTGIAIAPSYLLQLQHTATEVIAGVMVKYYTSNDTKYTGYLKRTSYGLGAYYRNQDAAIIYALLEWEEQYAVGLSYDLNISPLSKASGLRGGLELTLRYNAARTFLYQKMK